jgi:hypothetical protein
MEDRKRPQHKECSRGQLRRALALLLDAYKKECGQIPWTIIPGTSIVLPIVSPPRIKCRQ